MPQVPRLLFRQASRRARLHGDRHGVGLASAPSLWQAFRPGRGAKTRMIHLSRHTSDARRASALIGAGWICLVLAGCASAPMSDKGAQFLLSALPQNRAEVGLSVGERMSLAVE